MLDSKPSPCAVICDILPQNETVAGIGMCRFGFIFGLDYVYFKIKFNVCLKQIISRKRLLFCLISL